MDGVWWRRVGDVDLEMRGGGRRVVRARGGLSTEGWGCNFHYIYLNTVFRIPKLLVYQIFIHSSKVGIPTVELLLL
jgi:hypothetical protein